ncbi:lipoprotein-releasing ABC transporter permease subunit LolE [Colwellia hornerae]|uniref:Lipoprotein-releasing ABC transporter permease subunit LolE n=1 Tax=Colwellia hornerae TaxID=89402 RepID=A0A5C6QEF8_9GAMM|nr:lipoprotein-releasing ABC transporter permease subunit LolE [Colwellia hornerae]TWX51721.1 lipoprotein-releasing ABC transporter permease subunit LolE [Colwellia hornerae]TWX57509.1 lipoprotein-releasing ABC transporter permease subunit LolE [Colwellia hornerae]TWX67012.1 lipoprotein-releasing ABC transporter permease subunit LolE [Colwellia hornerae]
MTQSLSLFLGLRYVRSRNGNGFSSFISASSTIGIALGVMVLIIVLSAMNGFERALAQHLLSVIPHGELIAINTPIDNWQKHVAKAQQHPQVIAAAPVIKLTGMMQHGSELKAVAVRGVDLKLEQQVSTIADYMIAGSWQAIDDAENSENAEVGVVIGSGVAKKLQLELGDSLQLLLSSVIAQKSNQQANTKFPVPIKHQVNVVGIFKFGGTIDENAVYLSLEHAEKMVNLAKGQVQGIRIKVADVFQAPEVARDVAFSFDTYVAIHDWTRSHGHIFNDIQLVRLVMFIVLILVIAVASFNIVSTLIMAVNEKKGDIAILKTMGAPASVIMATFMFQGLVNGVVGCLVGTVLGIVISLNLTDIVIAVETLFNVKVLSGDIYFIDFLPTHLNQTDVIITVCTALLMSLLATIYPAWQATKVEPAQVLGQM